MDVYKAIETYVTKMVSTPSSMKVLLLDSHTVRPNFIFPPNLPPINMFIVCDPEDTNNLAFSNPIRSSFTPSLPHRPD